MSERRPSKESLAEIPEIDFSKAKSLGRGMHRDKRVSLATLREGMGKTQALVAQLAEMQQSEVSRLEHNDDALVSTLARYASALGGRLEVVIVVDDRRYPVDVYSSPSGPALATATPPPPVRGARTKQKAR